MKHIKLFELFVHSAYDNAGNNDVTPEELEKILKKRGYSMRKEDGTYYVWTGSHDRDEIWSELSDLGISNEESGLRGERENPDAINWVARADYEEDPDGLWVEIQYLGESVENREKKFYTQGVFILSPEHKAQIKKLVPDATFEVDDDGEARQLVWSDYADEKKLAQVVHRVTSGKFRTNENESPEWIKTQQREEDIIEMFSNEYDIEVSPDFDLTDFANFVGLEIDKAYIALMNMEDSDIMRDIASGNYEVFDLYDSSQFNDGYGDGPEMPPFEDEEDEEDDD